MQLMDCIGDALVACQAQNRVSYLAIAVLSLVSGDSHEVTLNAHPPTPMPFQTVIVCVIGLFHRKSRRAKRHGKKLIGCLFRQLFAHSRRVQQKSGAHAVQKDWGGPLDQLPPVVSSYEKKIHFRFWLQYPRDFL